MNPLLLFYLLGMFEESDEPDMDDGLDFKLGVWIVLGTALFLILLVLVFWELAKI